MALHSYYQLHVVYLVLRNTAINNKYYSGLNKSFSGVSMCNKSVLNLIIGTIWSINQQYYLLHLVNSNFYWEIYRKNLTTCLNPENTNCLWLIGHCKVFTAFVIKTKYATNLIIFIFPGTLWFRKVVPEYLYKTIYLESLIFIYIISSFKSYRYHPYLV